jgi:hypothetical protein
MTHSEQVTRLERDQLFQSPMDNCHLDATTPDTGWTEGTGTLIGMGGLDAYAPELLAFGIQESKSGEQDETSFGEHDSTRSLHVLMRLDADEAMNATPFELEARMLRAQSTFGCSKLAVDPPPPPYPAGLSKSSPLFERC